MRTLPPVTRPKVDRLRAHRALSTPRGSVALELALKRAAEVRERETRAPVAPPVEQPVRKRRGGRLFNRWTFAVAGVTLAAGVFLGLRWHRLAVANRQGTTAPALRLLTARDWWERAQQYADAGNFRLALGTVKYALALDPDDAILLGFEGDMHESLLQFRDAQASYEHALAVKPGDRRARQNLVLCHRINRRRDGTVRPGTLYNLHRVMLDQGRVTEALAITRRLSDDRALQQATWQAALDETGLTGRISVDAAGALELDLSGTVRPDLSLIGAWPLAGLNLADTGVDDLRALRGMALRRLDVSRTQVYDLEPLRGMPLQTLRIPRTGVVDLTPLAGCPLRELDISGTRVAGVETLAGMPLETLHANDTLVGDLRPLAALPLRGLWLARTRVADLRHLAHLGLRTLVLDGATVADLSPLTGAPLQELSLASTRVNDLQPLAGMPLNSLTLTDCVKGIDLSPLVSCGELEHLALPSQPRGLGKLADLQRLKFITSDEAGKPAR